MTDTSVSSQTTTTQDPIALVIPEETKTRFPDLVKMILESKSMNNQERNYWLQVLPVMTPDQVQELRNILETEVRKLAEIEAKYAPKPVVSLSAEEIAKLEEEKTKQREAAKKAEEEARKQQNPDDILSQLG